MVVTVSLSLTSALRGRVLTLSNVVGLALFPFSSGLSWVGDRAGGGVISLHRLWQLQQENQQLRNQLIRYQSMKLQLSEMTAANGRLRAELGLKRSLATWHLVEAGIIGRNPNSWFDTVVINQGTGDGIHPGMAAIVSSGVVGRVISANAHTATVMLLLDPSSGVGAMDVRSQAAGVLLGHDPVTGKLTFTLFSHRPNIMVGDAVVTSGFSSYYPKGLLLGQVSKVDSTNFGLTKTAIVQPSVDFNQIQSVMIVLSHPQGVSAPPIFPGGGP